MDENEMMDKDVVEQLFEQGLMGVEIPEEYGGAGMNFTSAIVGIEELAKVDPSVSVLVDVHNTLVNTAVMKYASPELKKKWLPKLATDTVGKSMPNDKRPWLTAQENSESISVFMARIVSQWPLKPPKPTMVTRSPVGRCGLPIRWKPTSSSSSPISITAKVIKA